MKAGWSLPRLLKMYFTPSEAHTRSSCSAAVGAARSISSFFIA